MNTAVLDTGFILALILQDDSEHEVCRTWWELDSRRFRLYLTPLTIAEVGYHLDGSGGPLVEAAFLRDLHDGAFGEIADLPPEDIARMAELVEQYSGLRLGSSDASVIALTERLGTRYLASVDLRDMRAVTPKQGPFTLIPYDV